MITKEFCDEWDGVGLNVKDMIEHFMDSESMFLKYLYKFFDSADSVVLELTSAAEREDYQQMLFSAHALKGLAGNIGLNGVFLPAKKIVDDIRSGDRQEIQAGIRRYSNAGFHRTGASRPHCDHRCTGDRHFQRRLPQGSAG